VAFFVRRTISAGESEKLIVEVVFEKIKRVQHLSPISPTPSGLAGRKNQLHSKDCTKYHVQQIVALFFTLKNLTIRMKPNQPTHNRAIFFKTVLHTRPRPAAGGLIWLHAPYC
jgi:hypothetical protein